MARKKKAFLLRIDKEVFDALEALAGKDLRSVNGQIEYLLREALERRGVKVKEPTRSDEPQEEQT